MRGGNKKAYVLPEVTPDAHYYRVPLRQAIASDSKACQDFLKEKEIFLDCLIIDQN